MWQPGLPKHEGVVGGKGKEGEVILNITSALESFQTLVITSKEVNVHAIILQLYYQISRSTSIEAEAALT